MDGVSTRAKWHLVRKNKVMNEELYKYNPVYRVSPTELLSNLLEENGFTYEDLFHTMFMRDCDTTSTLLEKCTEVPKSFWVNAQNNYTVD